MEYSCRLEDGADDKYLSNYPRLLKATKFDLPSLIAFNKSFLGSTMGGNIDFFGGLSFGGLPPLFNNILFKGGGLLVASPFAKFEPSNGSGGGGGGGGAAGFCEKTFLVNFM